MTEQKSAIADLNKKQRADRQFLLSRLDAAFTRISQLEKEQGRLNGEISDLKNRLNYEKDTAAAALFESRANDAQKDLEAVRPCSSFWVLLLQQRLPYTTNLQQQLSAGRFSSLLSDSSQYYANEEREISNAACLELILRMSWWRRC